MFIFNTYLRCGGQVSEMLFTESVVGLNEKRGILKSMSYDSRFFEERDMDGFRTWECRDCSWLPSPPCWGPKYRKQTARIGRRMKTQFGRQGRTT